MSFSESSEPLLGSFQAAPSAPDLLRYALEGFAAGLKFAGIRVGKSDITVAEC